MNFGMQFFPFGAPTDLVCFSFFPFWHTILLSLDSLFPLISVKGHYILPAQADNKRQINITYCNNPPYYEHGATLSN